MLVSCQWLSSHSKLEAAIGYLQVERRAPLSQTIKALEPAVL